MNVAVVVLSLLLLFLSMEETKLWLDGFASSWLFVFADKESQDRQEERSLLLLYSLRSGLFLDKLEPTNKTVRGVNHRVVTC